MLSFVEVVTVRGYGRVCRSSCVSGIMIAIGFLLMILSIFLLSMSGSSDVSAPVGGGGVGGRGGKGGKNRTFTKDVNRFFKNIMR